jgi:hypothetical protein
MLPAIGSLYPAADNRIALIWSARVAGCGGEDLKAKPEHFRSKPIELSRRRSLWFSMSYYLPMLMRFAILVIFVVAARAADDPFIGKWKLDLAKSKITGQTIEIQETGPGSYVFKEDEHSDEIFADGLDHLTHFGDTMAITRQTADTLVVMYKRQNIVTLNTVWKVAADGQTMTYTATGTRPNGLRFNNQMKLRRKAGTSGFSGIWEAFDVQLSSPLEINIEPWSGTGQLITYPERKQSVRMKFDGKRYPESGPTVDADLTSSGHRIDAHTIETTERIKDKVIETAKATISADGQTQTVVVTEPGDRSRWCSSTHAKHDNRQTRTKMVHCVESPCRQTKSILLRVRAAMLRFTYTCERFHGGRLSGMSEVHG